MPTLYEIDNRLAHVLDMGDEYVDTETGEIMSLEDIEALEMARDEKIEGWGLWLKNQNAMIDALRNEEKAFMDRRRALERKVQASQERYQMYLAGEKISTPRLSVSYRKVQAVEVTDADSIPTEYMREKISYEPDKTAIKTAIKSGETIPGAVLVERQSMIIK